MKDEPTSEQLDYQSAEQKDSGPHYTPRPRSQIILAWVLLAVVLFAIFGMCYWEMFGIF